MVIREIPVEELGRHLESGGRLIDVRERDEYERGHVPGAELVPLATLPDRLDEVEGSGQLFVICHSGGRSASACTFLAEHDIEATNVAGGTSAWIEAGGDTEPHGDT